MVLSYPGLQLMALYCIFIPSTVLALFLQGRRNDLVFGMPIQLKR